MAKAKAKNKKSVREVHVVVLDPDVAAYFRTDAEVNEALRIFKKIRDLVRKMKTSK